VIELLKAVIPERKQEIAAWNHDKDDYFSLGMLSLNTVTHQGSDRFLCFSTDDVGPFRFHLQHTGEKLFLRDVQGLSEDENERNSACTPSHTDQTRNE
jgi:hypothetical protein